jgi:hypothetical protein
MEQLLYFIGSLHYRPILAYIDAGTGSIIIQVVIAVIAGGGVAVKLFWKNITRRFRHPEKEKKEESKDTVAK